MLILAYADFLAVVYLHAERLIFAPHRVGYSDSSELITLTNAKQQSLKVYFLPPLKEDGIIVLFSHGHDEDIADLLPKAHQAHAQGYGVVLYDYQGYGLSYGRPSETACYQDAIAVYDYLTQELQYSAKQLVVYGHSLGAAVALELALQRKVHYLIMDSPFLSAFRAATKWPLVPWDQFNNLCKITRLASDCYLEIRYSKQDCATANSSQKLYQVSLSGYGKDEIAHVKLVRQLISRDSASKAYRLDDLPSVISSAKI